MATEKTRKRDKLTIWIWYVAREAIKERKIALPLKRIHWYCNWLFVPCTRAQVRTAMETGVEEGRFIKVTDGRCVYYKNAPKRVS